MEHRKISRCSYQYWKEKFLLIYAFFAAFFCSMLEEEGYKPFGQSNGIKRKDNKHKDYRDMGFSSGEVGYSYLGGCSGGG